MKKKDIRRSFRRMVFERDRYCCVVCNKPGIDRQGSDGHLRFHGTTPVELDAHHITNRSEMANGGYVVENGITLCPECHILAEYFWQSGNSPGFEPDTLYAMIGSSHKDAIIASLNSKSHR